MFEWTAYHRHIANARHRAMLAEAEERRVVRRLCQKQGERTMQRMRRTGQHMVQWFAKKSVMYRRGERQLHGHLR